MRINSLEKLIGKRIVKVGKSQDAITLFTSAKSFILIRAYNAEYESDPASIVIDKKSKEYYSDDDQVKLGLMSQRAFNIKYKALLKMRREQTERREKNELVRLLEKYGNPKDKRKKTNG